MPYPENDNRTDDVKADEQNEQAETTEEIGDLEPKKDVKGGRLI
jgi:hypothetical protein